MFLAIETLGHEESCYFLGAENEGDGQLPQMGMPQHQLGEVGL